MSDQDDLKAKIKASLDAAARQGYIVPDWQQKLLGMALPKLRVVHEPQQPADLGKLLESRLKKALAPYEGRVVGCESAVRVVLLREITQFMEEFHLSLPITDAMLAVEKVMDSVVEEQIGAGH